jgi:hypothetical protein
MEVNALLSICSVSRFFSWEQLQRRSLPLGREFGVSFSFLPAPCYFLCAYQRTWDILSQQDFGSLLFFSVFRFCKVMLAPDFVSNEILESVLFCIDTHPTFI